MAQGFGTVKAILSGDTVVILGKAAAGGPPPELQLSLSHLSAPRLSRHPDTKDEPFAWASREFLRKLLIGKVVRFRVDYKVEKIQRSFGSLWLQDVPASVNSQVATAGWAKPAPSADAAKAGSGGVLTDEFDALLAASQAAQTEGRGMFNAAPGEVEASIRSITWSISPTDAPAIAAGLAGQGALPAVVEQVINGGLLRVLVPAASSPNAFLALTMGMAGIQCPKAPAAAPAPAPAAATGAAATSAAARLAKAAAPGPSGASSDSEAAIGSEAKLFTELRLLNRDVRLLITGADKPSATSAATNATFWGRVEHPAGDIAAELLKAGLARMVDYSLPPASGPAGPSIGAMRAAERAAKAAQARIWAGYVPKALPASMSGAGAKEYDGKVVEVVSGDTVVVQVSTPGGGFEDRRVTLSSIRAPRLAPRGGPSAAGGPKDAPWAVEAREFVRRALIGRDVHVSVEYVKAPNPEMAAAGGPGGSDRVFGTVSWATKKGEPQNVATGLVTEGLAEVQRHRAGDEERSAAYDELLAAEDAAKAAKRGLFSGKDAPAHARIVDVSTDAAKAKGHLGFLQRARTVRGVVDHVIPGGRMRVTVPSENVTILFAIAGVRSPATARAAAGKGPDGKPRPSRAGEPCGEESFRWLRESVNQQEVEIEVEEGDRTGAMLGAMWVGKGGARRSVGAELLRRGLAYGVHPIIERVRYADELVAAESEARGVKRGVWEHYVQPSPEDEQDEGEQLADALAAANVSGGAPAAEGAFPTLGGAAPSAPASAPSPSAAAAGIIKGTVCEVVDGSTLFLNAESDRPKLASVTAKMEELLAEVGTQSALVDTKKGKVVACVFAEAGSGAKWYRARIEGKSKDASGSARTDATTGLDLWDVTFLDYGHTDAAPVSRMRPLEPPFSTMPALAKEYGLAFVRVPSLAAEHGSEAAHLLSDFTYGQPVAVRVHSKDPVTGTPLAAVYADDYTGTHCVNEELIRAGLARVASREARRIKRRLGPGANALATAANAGGDKDAQLLLRLEAAQADAKKGRKGIYRYGDVGDSDDERDDRRPGGAAGGGAWGGAKR